MEVSRTPDKRTRPRFIVGVGGVEGLLVLGGSLAIAGFMALFTIKTSTRKSSKGVDSKNDIKETVRVDEMEKVEFSLDDGSEGKTDVALNQQGNETNGGSKAEESISTVSNEEEKVVAEAAKQDKLEKEDEEEEEAECQHEILVLSDDSTPPESIVSCDDYTDFSLDEEKGSENEEDVEGDDDYESSSEEEEESEVTEHSSSLSSLLVEEAALKELSEIDPSNYESIAKEQNSFNCLGFEKKNSSGMLGSRSQLRPMVGQHPMVSVPPSLTKPQLWLMVLPVVMLTMLLAMIHFFVVDNYVMDMEF